MTPEHYVNQIINNTTIHDEYHRNGGKVIDWQRPHSNEKERAHWCITNIDKITVKKLPSTINCKRRSML